MSTKSTIKHGPDFHLYREIFEEGVVYLRAEGINFEAHYEGDRSEVTIRLSEHTAIALGLLPASEVPEREPTASAEEPTTTSSPSE